MTRSAPTIPPPHPAPRIPSFRLPHGACDTHCHVFGPDRLYPYVPERPYTPPDAPLEKLRGFHDRMGVSRAVLVNATPHGRDNRVVTDAIATDPARYRGVGNVDEGFDDAELRRLADAGIVCCRFTFIPRLGKAPDLDMLDRIARRIARLGWHVDLHLPASALADVGARLEALPVPYVLDHMGEVGIRVEQITFRNTPDAVVALLRNDVQVVIDSFASLKASFDDRRAVALATTGSARSQTLPQVPTVAEAGGPATFDVTSWNALFAKAGTPPEAIEALSAGLRDVLGQADIRARLLDLGIEARWSQRAELANRLVLDIERWSGVIDRAGIPKQ